MSSLFLPDRKPKNQPVFFIKLVRYHICETAQKKNNKLMRLSSVIQWWAWHWELPNPRDQRYKSKTLDRSRSMTPSVRWRKLHRCRRRRRPKNKEVGTWPSDLAFDLLILAGTMSNGSKKVELSVLSGWWGRWRWPSGGGDQPRLFYNKAHRVKGCC